MDRNVFLTLTVRNVPIVALRKESVDRNIKQHIFTNHSLKSLSARRAWIEMFRLTLFARLLMVALRKESVDRNGITIEKRDRAVVALRKESVDRNNG